MGLGLSSMKRTLGSSVIEYAAAAQFVRELILNAPAELDDKVKKKDKERNFFYLLSLMREFEMKPKTELYERIKWFIKTRIIYAPNTFVYLALFAIMSYYKETGVMG